MNKNNTPLISVLMTVFNTERYVGDAIKSILDQTYTNFEFIIVDDCSTDSTNKILKGYALKDQRIKIIRNKKNIKAGDSSNRGIAVCKGKYIIRMDADDWSYPDRIEKQTQFMEKNPTVVAAGGAMLVCNEDMQPIGTRHYHSTDTAIRKEILRLNPVPHPASIWRKEVLLKTNLYNSRFNPSEDYALIVEISTLGKLANIDNVLIKFRVHSQSISNSKMILQQKITLLISDIAINTYRYKPNMKDLMWKYLQILTMYTLPPKFKRYLLNKLVLKKSLVQA